ncbi:hypothetical protein [Amycolatopsis regifaucium]|uniref:Uncharacterized protein n=1 Tax=Amycolatopsis regifaucium TaxID=546365 RepID=A0A154MG86_9PSEU|nr:hypothetical protein [Amycolatopsis regifaucium]KZB82559.1 hypothetical protein AVL48_07635 [Amycolatopsis regifaucium]OKA06508.1 hypothetical protein ATP06_0223370 [Amycolatopsis regifaucium]SFG73499.1 hypothetical protein SAMN04489731_101302 [Amycolatopsis regifaucium]
MAVRLTTLLFRREDERLASGKRRDIGLELRQRFGFSLIQAPLRRQPPWNSEVDFPGRRGHRDMIRTGRPLEGRFELSPLIGHLAGRV